MSLRLVSVGECTIDNYVDLKREFVGGISLNFAVHSKRCGADAVSFLSCMGPDCAERILQKLAAEEIDTSCVAIRDGFTARQNIVLTGNGERIFPPGEYTPGVLQGFLLDSAALQHIQRHDVLASTLFEQVEPLFRQVISIPFEGWRVADFLDLSDYNKDIGVLEKHCERLRIAFVSGDRELVEQLRPLSRSTQCMIVITMGPEGSAALLDGQPVLQPPIPAPRIVDSTGCGDAFQAAFTVCFWRTRDVRTALEAGARQAATVIQHYGATR